MVDRTITDICGDCPSLDEGACLSGCKLIALVHEQKAAIARKDRVIAALAGYCDSAVIEGPFYPGCPPNQQETRECGVVGHDCLQCWIAWAEAEADKVQP